MKKLFYIFSTIVILLALLLFAFDQFYMPWLVSSEEVVVPNVIGLDKEQAHQMLQNLKLNPVIQGPKYDNLNPKPENQILLQRPSAGSTVKVNRRIYIFYSGGAPKIEMPDLTNKTLRDAKITLERLKLAAGEVKEIRSEKPANTIVEQEFEPGSQLEKGTVIALTVSYGPKLGHIRTPGLIGKSLGEAKKILTKNSLHVGKITYFRARNLVANTIDEQSPSEGSLIAVGDSVNITVTRR
ncbi:MAG: PASTA domain-containing protein [Rhodothermaceae bacterium]